MNFDTIKKKLEALGYKVSCFDTTAEATEYINGEIDGKTVGFGGSMTLEEMGLYEALSTHNDVRWHQRIPEGKTSKEVRLAANAAEIYVSSVNGLAETGEIINIDGAGNRVASTLYGHEKVYYIVGKKKLAETYDDALCRARNIASPKNARKLGRKTPCAINADKCYDCKSPDRICRGLVVMWEPMMNMEAEVILIDEELGF